MLSSLSIIFINIYQEHIKIIDTKLYLVLSITSSHIDCSSVVFVRDETESKKKSEKDKETKKIKQERISRDVRAYTGLALFRIHLK